MSSRVSRMAFSRSSRCASRESRRDLHLGELLAGGKGLPARLVEASPQRRDARREGGSALPPRSVSGARRRPVARFEGGLEGALEQVG